MIELEQNSGEKCHCPHHKMIGVFVALFGLTFLLGSLDVISQRVVSITWPILVTLIGLQKVFQTKCTCCPAQ